MSGRLLAVSESRNLTPLAPFLFALSNPLAAAPRPPATRAQGQVMKPLRVEFEMTPEDLPSAVEIVVDRDPGIQESLQKAQCIVAVIILALSAFLAIGYFQPGPEVYVASMGLVIAVILFLLTRFPTRQSWRQAARRQGAATIESAAGKACLGPRSVEVGEDGIAIASEFARTLITWRGVFDVIQTADLLVLVLPGPTYMCVPRRAFNDDSDFEQFGNVLAEKATRGGLIGKGRSS